MDELSEWVAMIGVTALGAFTLSFRSLAFVSRLRGREVEVPLACPRTGSDVRCTLVHDEKARRYLDVLRCSAFGADATPTCEKHCRELLNLGMPLGSGGATRESWPDR